MRRYLYLALALVLAGLVVHSAVRVIAGRSHHAPTTTSPGGPATAAKATQATVRPRLPANPSLADLRAAVAGANVVIVVIDAARADHVGCYGYPRDTTPELDRLARESVVFEQHFCPYPATTPSTASLLTSLYPDTHGVLGALGTDALEYQGMDPAILTLEKSLRSAGYHTFMLTANEAASPAVGVGEDFDEVFRQRQVGPGRRDRGDSTRHLVRELAHALSEHQNPHFFAYLHFLPPHSPYDAPGALKSLFSGKQPPISFQTPAFLPQATEEYRAGPPPADRAEWINLYDANLRWADQAVGEVRGVLEKAGLLEDTLLIVTADHGEALAEHGYVWHENVPYDEALHIPLLIRFPGGRLIRRSGALTQTVDVMPTILELLGMDTPTDALQGRSLAPLLTGGKTAVREYAFAQTYGPYYCRVARDKDWVLLQYRDGPSALYHIAVDPRQTRNMIASHPDRADGLGDALRKFEQQQAAFAAQTTKGKQAGTTTAPRRKLSEDTRRELRALGYLK